MGHELREVVEHASLVHEQVRELAHAGGVVDGSRRADDVRRVLRVGLPEVHLRDPVGLGDDPLRESERLEGLDAAGLDAVGLPDREPPVATIDDARRDAGKLGQLSRRDHTGRAGADDEHVDEVGEFFRAIDADTCEGLDARITGHVTAMMELHEWPHFSVNRCSIIELLVQLSHSECTAIRPSAP